MNCFYCIRINANILLISVKFFIKKLARIFSEHKIYILNANRIIITIINIKRNFSLTKYLAVYNYNAVIFIFVLRKKE